MTPELRALADRFICEQATVKHILTLSPADAHDRPVHDGEWSVRQLFAHLAASLGEYEAIIVKLTRGEPALDNWDPEATNRQTAANYASRSIDDVLALFGSGLNGLIDAMAGLPDERLTDQFGPGEVLPGLQALGEHYLSHAITLVDALPEVRFDPLVLNWLLSAEFEDEASVNWQAKLYADAEEFIASQPEEEEDDE